MRKAARTLIYSAFFLLTFFLLGSTAAENETIDTKKDIEQLTQSGSIDSQTWTVQEASKVFFSTYHPWDKRQTDDDPCTAASMKDICKLLNSDAPPIALTKDMRKELSIKWGDVVRLEWWKCDGLYTVLDEMASKYRKKCIKRKGYCVKWDFAKSKSSRTVCDGVYSIIKIEFAKTHKKAKKQFDL